MTEASFTQDLLAKVRANLPGVVALKHCDRFTSGVPDTSLTKHPVTLWIEIKLLKASSERQLDPTTWAAFDRVQFNTLYKMGGYYLVRHAKTREIAFVPAAAFDRVNYHLVAPRAVRIFSTLDDVVAHLKSLLPQGERTT